MTSGVYAKVSDLAAATTSHNSGLKKVFLADNDSPTNLTQFSYGMLLKDEVIEFHSHDSMEEFYYFLSGTGTFTIEENSFAVEQGVFIRVPNKSRHSLKNTGDEELRFVYFGIAL